MTNPKRQIHYTRTFWTNSKVHHQCEELSITELYIRGKNLRGNSQRHGVCRKKIIETGWEAIVCFKQVDMLVGMFYFFTIANIETRRKCCI